MTRAGDRSNEKQGKCVISLLSRRTTSRQLNAVRSRVMYDKKNTRAMQRAKGINAANLVFVHVYTRTVAPP